MHLPLNLSPIPSNIFTPDNFRGVQITRCPETLELLDRARAPRGGELLFVKGQGFDARKFHARHQSKMPKSFLGVRYKERSKH